MDGPLRIKSTDHEHPIDREIAGITQLDLAGQALIGAVAVTGRA